MKAEIRKDGYIHIIAETATEAFALKAIHPLGKGCKHCGQIPTKVVIDGSILTEPENLGRFGEI